MGVPINWKCIIVKVFIFIIFTLSRLKRKKKQRGWYCCLRGSRDGRGWGGGRGGKKACKHGMTMEIHYNFYLKFLLVHFSNGILLSHKMNKILSFLTTWIQLEIIILSEVSQKEKDKFHMILESKIWHKWTYLQYRNRCTDIDHRLVVAKGESREWNGLRV